MSSMSAHFALNGEPKWWSKKQPNHWLCLMAANFFLSSSLYSSVGFFFHPPPSFCNLFIHHYGCSCLWIIYNYILNAHRIAREQLGFKTRKQPKRWAKKREGRETDMLQVSYDHILFFCGTRCVNKGEGKQKPVKTANQVPFHYASQGSTEFY